MPIICPSTEEQLRKRLLLKKPSKRSLSFKDDVKSLVSMESHRMWNSIGSSKSFCQLDLMFDLGGESTPDLRCYKVSASPDAVFHHQKQPQSQRQRQQLMDSNHGLERKTAVDLRRNRSMHDCRKLLFSKQNGLSYPNGRAHSCKLARKNVDFDERPGNIPFSMESDFNDDEEEQLLSQADPSPEWDREDLAEKKIGRNLDEVILQFPENLNRRNEIMLLRRSRTSPDLWQKTGPGKSFDRSQNFYHSLAQSSRNLNRKCQSLKLALAKNFSRQSFKGRIGGSVLGPKPSFELMPVPGTNDSSKLKSRSENEIFGKRLAEQQGQVRIQSDSQLAARSASSRLAAAPARVIPVRQLRSRQSELTVTTTCDSSQPQPDEGHQSKILFIIVAVFLICSLPRAILNLVEFEHMFSLYYLAYFVSGDDEVALKARELQANEEIACFYPPLWFVVFTNVSSFLMTINASLGFLIYSLGCSIFRAELSLRLKRLRNCLRAKCAKLFNVLYCRTERINV